MLLHPFWHTWLQAHTLGILMKEENNVPRTSPQKLCMLGLSRRLKAYRLFEAPNKVRLLPSVVIASLSLDVFCALEEVSRVGIGLQSLAQSLPRMYQQLTRLSLP